MKSSLFFKAVLALIIGLLIWSWVAPQSKSNPATTAFGRLPVLENGRLKPIDTVARSYLLSFQGKQLLKLDHNPQEATAWLLTLLTNQEKAHQYPIFRIYHPGVKQLIGKSDKDGKYFSFSEIRPFMPLLYEQAQNVLKIEAGQRNPYDRAVLQLFNQIEAYMQLQASFLFPGATHRTAELQNYETLIQNGHSLLGEHQTTVLSDTQRTTLSELLETFKRVKQVEPLATIRIIPPQNQDAALGEWQSLPTALLVALKPQPIHQAVHSYAKLLDSYPAQEDQFLKTATQYHAWLSKTYPKEMSKIELEVRFNQFQPFYKSLLLYVVVFILVLCVWLKGGKNQKGLYQLSFQLLCVAFVIHTSGILIRMYLQGRPPITNLYTSAVFVGWIAVLLGIFLERLNKNGVGSVVASCIGFMTLIIAHHLSLTGDTLEMMQAVLDSNFWLATHVITINIGYGATIVAGILAHIFIFKRLFSKTFSSDQQKSISKMVYGSACFAILFMVIGTVLGGVWADQSWGRFWGWDPKENGALMIVLWLAILLHARLGGLIKDRGLMVMSVFSNIVTSFSWFGVNMLGIGLHSYGFMEKTFFWLMLFILVQCFVMWMAFIPVKARELKE